MCKLEDLWKTSLIGTKVVLIVEFYSHAFLEADSWVFGAWFGVVVCVASSDVGDLKGLDKATGHVRGCGEQETR